jgi:hypothetical protein
VEEPPGQQPHQWAVRDRVELPSLVRVSEDDGSELLAVELS